MKAVYHFFYFVSLELISLLLVEAIVVAFYFFIRVSESVLTVQMQSHYECEKECVSHFFLLGSSRSQMATQKLNSSD